MGDAIARGLVAGGETEHMGPVGFRERRSPPRLAACLREHMTELDHLPRHEIGDVDPDVPLRQLRRFCDRRRYLRDERVLTLGGAAAADLSVTNT